MAEQDPILPEEKLPNSQDFNFLRGHGTKIIEKLSGDLWTDYNTHDPGITLLESLCYTLTDLAYRTSLDIKDLLASAPGEEDKHNDIFPYAHEILPCNPVTINDYRKLAIDTEGINAAWIEPALQYEVPLSPGNNQQLSLKGLYRVLVEFDSQVKEKDEHIILENLKKRLHNHRNLCEDFLVFTRAAEEKFIINAEIQANEGAYIETIAARVFHIMQHLVSNPVRFYSLEQMRERGYSTDQIFEGPLLKHGFIEDVELELAGSKPSIHLSDIIKLVLEIPGVIAVKRFIFTESEGAIFSNFNEWTSKVYKQHQIIKLDIEKSKIDFVRSGDRHRNAADHVPDPILVKQEYAFLQAEQKTTKLKKYSNKLIPPSGIFQHPGYYHAFQHHLPAVYLSEETRLVPANDQARRRLEILQLKGYLMVFEQIMADYLSMLGNLSKIFSTNPDEANNFFPAVIDNIIDLDKLIINAEQYRSGNEAKDSKAFYRKRNAILDHLLARLGEDMNRLTFYLKNQKHSSADLLIEAKSEFLKDFIRISNYRGRGFNYQDEKHSWNSDIVPGVKQRIARLTGLRSFRNENITNEWIDIVDRKDTSGSTVFEVVVKDPKSLEHELFKSDPLNSHSEAREILAFILMNGGDRSYYKENTEGGQYHYRLLRVTESKKVSVGKMSFPNSTERNDNLKALVQALRDYVKHDNFHLLEHILLRPRLNVRNEMDETEVAELLEMPRADEKTELKAQALNYIFRKQETETAPPDSKKIWRLSLLAARPGGVKILEVRDEFAIEKDVETRITRIREAGADKKNYTRSETRDGSPIFSIMTGDTMLAQGSVQYENTTERELEIDRLVEYFSYDQTQPGGSQDAQPPIPEQEDPYSFQVSVFVPGWSNNCRQPSFRHLLDKTIAAEMPAHIFPNIYWLDYMQMKAFEAVYRPWMQHISLNEVPENRIVNNLVRMVNQFRKKENNA
jgi:hypothetical protein